MDNSPKSEKTKKYMCSDECWVITSPGTTPEMAHLFCLLITKVIPVVFKLRGFFLGCLEHKGGEAA